MNGDPEYDEATDTKRMLDSAHREIYGSSVVLIADEKLRGSGTLMRVGDHYGILTAQHVTKIFNGRKDYELGVAIDERLHRFTLDNGSSRIIDVGIPVGDDDSLGPDLSFVLITRSDKIDTLVQKKQFYPNQRRPSSPDFPYDELSWAISGAPKVWMEPPDDETRLSMNHMVARGRFDALTKRGEFDFVSITLAHSVDGFPDTFGGVSGGGMWILPTKKGPDGWFCEAPILGGVAYHELPLSDSVMRITGHGPASINCVMPRILAAAM